MFLWDSDRRIVIDLAPKWPIPTCLQGSESQGSLSELSCSGSASSFQTVSQGSMAEILVGLVYNATTGRLSVEIIKGCHFKNLAANKPPSKYTKAF